METLLWEDGPAGNGYWLALHCANAHSSGDVKQKKKIKGTNAVILPNREDQVGELHLASRTPYFVFYRNAFPSTYRAVYRLEMNTVFIA